MYAVVETTNHLGQKEVSVVLSSWIKDEKYIYWPPNHYKALKKIMNPDASWTLYPCVVLKQNLLTYSEAKAKEKFLSENSCSEIDEGSIRLPSKLNFNTEFETFQTINNNNPMFIEPLISYSEICLYKINESNDTTTFESIAEAVRSPVVKELPPQTPNPQEIKSVSTAHISLELNSLPPDKKSEDDLAENLNYICNEIKKIRKHSKCQTELIKEQNLKLEDLRKELANTNQNIENFISSSLLTQQKIKKIAKDNEFIYPSVPLSTIEGLDLLYAKLNQNYYMEQMIIRLYKYRTTNINKSVKQMFEHLIHYKIIKLYSWAGQSGIAKGIHKLIFMDLHNIIQLAENTLNYLNLDAPVTTDETKKAIQQFLKRSTIVMTRSSKKLN